MGSIPQAIVNSTEETSNILVFPARFNRHIQLRTGAIKLRRVDTFRVWNAWLERVVDDDGVAKYEIRGNDGWLSFRKDNFICLGDIMHLQYPGNRVFLVRLYDPFGHPKYISSGPNPYLVGGRMKVTDAPLWEAEASTGADTYIGYSPYPAFKILMNKQYVGSGFATIPLGFAKAFMFPGGQIPKSKDVILYNAHGGIRRSWRLSVAGYHRKDGVAYNCKFCGGFRSFVEFNSIKVGFLCTFELTATEPTLTFRVVRFAE